VVCGGLLATVAAVYPTIARPPDPTDNAPSSETTSTTDVPNQSTTIPASTTTTTAIANPPTTLATPAPTTTAPTTTVPSPPQCATRATTATVEMSPGAGQAHVGEVTYTVDEAKDPYIEIAGRLTGTPAAGSGLYAVKTGVTGTYDSTPNRNPASVGFFMHPELRLRAGGCWTLPSSRLGYDCVGGVAFRFYFALLSHPVADALTAQEEANGDNGLPRDSILNNPDVDVIGSITVPTRPHPACPN
jgi:hypothetical protein